MIIYQRKSEVSVKRISVCSVTENLSEYGIHCLSCSYTNDIINITTKMGHGVLYQVNSMLAICMY